VDACQQFDSTEASAPQLLCVMSCAQDAHALLCRKTYSRCGAAASCRLHCVIGMPVGAMHVLGVQSVDAFLKMHLLICQANSANLTGGAIHVSYCHGVRPQFYKNQASVLPHCAPSTDPGWMACPRYAQHHAPRSMSISSAEGMIDWCALRLQFISNKAGKFNGQVSYNPLTYPAGSGSSSGKPTPSGKGCPQPLTTESTFSGAKLGQLVGLSACRRHAVLFAGEGTACHPARHLWTANVLPFSASTHNCTSCTSGTGTKKFSPPWFFL